MVQDVNRLTCAFRDADARALCEQYDSSGGTSYPRGPLIQDLSWKLRKRERADLFDRNDYETL